MSRVKFGRLLAFVLVSAMAASALTGCSGYALKKKEETVTVAKADTSLIFTEVETPLNTVSAASVGNTDDMVSDGIMFSCSFAKNGKYYTMYSDPTAGSKTYLSTFDGAGKKASKISLPTPEDGIVNCISADSKDNIYTVSGEANDKGDMVYVIRSYNEKRKRVWGTRIKAGVDFEPLGMVSLDDFTAVLSGESLLIFDNKEGKQKNVKLPASDMISKICTDSSGNILLVGWKDFSELAVWRMDSETCKFTSVKVTGKGFGYSDGVASGNGKYDFYLTKEDGVYGFTAKEHKPVKIVDFSSSDLMFMEISSLAMLSSESALILSYDDDMNSVPTLLKKMDQKAASEKKTLTIGCLQAPYELKEDVYKFNKRSEKYRISIIEYSPVDLDVSTLNAAIISGDVPDIICVNDNMPVESYVNKGVFEDIEPYFKGDAEISGNQYLENILDAYRVDGGMYFVTPYFSLMGLVGSKKDFGDSRGITVDMITEKIGKYKMNYEKALGFVTRTSVLSWITDYSNDQFIDPETGSCSFDSDYFIKLLKFAKCFPGKISDSLMQEDDIAWIRNKEQLLEEMYLISVDIYQDIRYGTFGEEIVYTGFPGNGEQGPVIYCPYYLAMSEESDAKDTCWDFLRQYYLDDFQNNCTSCFPVSREALEKQFEKAMTPEYFTYLDENGHEVTEQSEVSLTIAGKKIVIPLPDEDDIAQIRKYIESADTRSITDVRISSIIKEEVGAYFEGQKTAEQTADIIQRRVSIYLKEIM